MLGKNVAYILFDQSRIAANALMTQSTTYKLSFYLNQSTQPSVVLTCKKAMAQQMTADELKSLSQKVDTSKQYTMYIGEITQAEMR